MAQIAKIDTELKKFKAKLIRISNKRLSNKDYPRELTIVSEGDSWFDYPFRKDIIDYLRKNGYAVANLAKAGDTLENMVYGKKNKNNPKSLKQTIAAVKLHKPKFVLFSAGGNDIVGNEIKAYLNHKGARPENVINDKIFKEKLKWIQAAIETFIISIHKANKNAHVLMDGYAYARVNGKK